MNYGTHNFSALKLPPKKMFKRLLMSSGWYEQDSIAPRAKN